MKKEIIKEFSKLGDRDGEIYDDRDLRVLKFWLDKLQARKEEIKEEIKKEIDKEKEKIFNSSDFNKKEETFRILSNLGIKINQL